MFGVVITGVVGVVVFVELLLGNVTGPFGVVVLFVVPFVVVLQ